jgi:hypothetical protein
MKPALRSSDKGRGRARVSPTSFRVAPTTRCSPPTGRAMSPARTPTPDNSAALVPSAWCALYESMAARFGDVAAAQQQPGIPPVRVLDKPLAITPPAVRRIVRPVKKLRAPVVSTLAALAAGCAFAPLASAQTIGVAATVRNDVAQVKGASALPISLG